DDDKKGTDAVAKERLRVKGIRAVAAQARVDDAELNKWIDNGTSVAQAREKALSIVAQRDNSGAPSGYVRTGTHVGRDGMRAAMANAILHRTNPGAHKLTDNARDFRGMTLMGMVGAALEADGQNVRG